MKLIFKAKSCCCLNFNLTKLFLELMKVFCLKKKKKCLSLHEYIWWYVRWVLFAFPAINLCRLNPSQESGNICDEVLLYLDDSLVSISLTLSQIFLLTHSISFTEMSTKSLIHRNIFFSYLYLTLFQRNVKILNHQFFMMLSTKSEIKSSIPEPSSLAWLERQIIIRKN